MSGGREVREEQLAHWLTLVAVALFVLSGAVLALDAHAYGWAALLFAAAACVGLSTGVLDAPPRPGTLPVPPVQEIKRYRLAHPGASIGDAIDALRKH